MVGLCTRHRTGTRRICTRTRRLRCLLRNASLVLAHRRQRLLHGVQLHAERLHRRGRAELLHDGSRMRPVRYGVALRLRLRREGGLHRRERRVRRLRGGVRARAQSFALRLGRRVSFRPR